MKGKTMQLCKWCKWCGWSRAPRNPQAHAPAWEARWDANTEKFREKGDGWKWGAKQMFSFDTCNSGYSFSSKSVLLSAKITIAKKWHYEPWGISMKCLCQSTHVWGVLLWLQLLHGLGKPADGNHCHQEWQPWGALTTAPLICTTPQHWTQGW